MPPAHAAAAAALLAAVVALAAAAPAAAVADTSAAGPQPPRFPPPGPGSWHVTSRHDFLSAFRGRCVLVSGDSVSRESFWSLLLWAHGCSADGGAPLALVPDDASRAAANATAGAAGVTANDVLDDGSGMGLREYAARFASRGLGRLASCGWFAANLRNRARRDIRVPVDADPANDVRVRWAWAPYVADLPRTGAVQAALDGSGEGGCDVVLLNAGFWNLRRARSHEERARPDREVAAAIALLDAGGRPRAVAARGSIVWRSCTLLEGAPEPDAWFDNAHVRAYNARVDRAWRTRGFAVVNPLRLFAGIAEGTPPGEWRFTRDGIHPVFLVHVRLLRELLTAALRLKLRGGGAEGWAPPAPTPYPPLPPTAALEGLAAWEGEVAAWRAAHANDTAAAEGGGVPGAAGAPCSAPPPPRCGARPGCSAPAPAPPPAGARSTRRMGRGRGRERTGRTATPPSWGATPCRRRRRVTMAGCTRAAGWATAAGHGWAGWAAAPWAATAPRPPRWWRH